MLRLPPFRYHRPETVADAVSLLAILFQGHLAPDCADTMDGNDDGQLNVADAIYVLNFLFSGTAAPPPPFPERGVDPTRDDLACAP